MPLLVVLQRDVPLGDERFRLRGVDDMESEGSGSDRRSGCDLPVAKGTGDVIYSNRDSLVSTWR